MDTAERLETLADPLGFNGQDLAKRWLSGGDHQRTLGCVGFQRNGPGLFWPRVLSLRLSSSESDTVVWYGSNV
jgi:hypothetical protein